MFGITERVVKKVKPDSHAMCPIDLALQDKKIRGYILVRRDRR